MHFLKFKFIYFNWRLITLQYCIGFAIHQHESTYGCTHVPHPEPPSHLPPHTIPLGHPSAPAPSILYPASNLDWRFISHMILYMFKCHSPKSSHPFPLHRVQKTVLYIKNKLGTYLLSFTISLKIKWDGHPWELLWPRNLFSLYIISEHFIKTYCLTFDIDT